MPAGSIRIPRTPSCTSWDELRKVHPGYSFEQRRRVLPYREAAQIEPIVDGLAKAGIAA